MFTACVTSPYWWVWGSLSGYHCHRSSLQTSCSRGNRRSNRTWRGPQRRGAIGAAARVPGARGRVEVLSVDRLFSRRWRISPRGGIWSLIRSGVAHFRALVCAAVYGGAEEMTYWNEGNSLRNFCPRTYTVGVRWNLWWPRKINQSLWNGRLEIQGALLAPTLDLDLEATPGIEQLRQGSIKVCAGFNSMVPGSRVIFLSEDSRS